MELSEALRTIDATAGFLRHLQSIENANLVEVEDDEEGLGVLAVQVYTTRTSTTPIRKCRLKYQDGVEFEFIIPQIAPVCDFLIDNWPSHSAKKLRSHIDETNVLYLANEILGLNDPMMYETMTEAYEYQSLLGERPSLLLYEIYDINYRLAYALRMTEDEESDTQEEQIYITDDRIVTENIASQMDWLKVTKKFNPDAIKDLVKNIGKSKREKKIVIEAIYDAMTRSGELSRIPYSVDKLLDDLHRTYDENHKGVYEAYDEKRETLNLDILMMEAIEEYMKKHKATDEDIDEIFNNASAIQKIDKPPVVLDSVPEEFKNDEAKELMLKLSCAGLVSDDWQPTDLSIAERGYLAGEIASRLNIKNKWVVLGKLWGQKPETLRQGNNKATGQAKTGLFIEKLKRILD
ncbi:hypothetical protein SAMN04487900_1332 [Prevotella communis]|uniref:Uncharacterized protein n=1 Tax=Prevotella communis TaxID=2913614 RepID=A0A1H0KWV9_9BACT|nr:hypothetical protein [Prevotella communis]SDO60261.1 hypothetical protein SAMN04487900_1332 [Prevotella communis]